ncbi:MAG: acetylornithine/N-succinyldiaminopimelate aminotransferase [Arenicella sp.]|jgi:acetylornithine/N-succinyldiaminopimelate aminotransferase
MSNPSPAVPHQEKTAYEQAREAMMATYAPPELEFVRGEGPYVYTKEGDKYLDFFAGIAVNCLGHAHPQLVSVLQQQASEIWHLSNAFRVPKGEELAKTLAQLSGLDRVFFTNSGTESVECGLKMIHRYHYDRGNPERYRIIGTSSAFHGRSFAAICAAGNPTHIKGFSREDEGFDHVPFNDLAAIEAAITDKTAGIIIEPVQGEGGIKVADASYLKGLRALCDRHGILLMFDEVQCGIARTGKLFGFQHSDVQPDIIAIAKGLGGGFPVGATIATQEVAKSMVVGTHGSTYGGNFLAMAVASKVIDIVSQDEFLQDVVTISASLRECLQGLVDKYPSVLSEVRGSGLMLGLRCHNEDANGKILMLARENKILLTKAGDNVLRLLPPLIINQSHVDEAIEKLDLALASYAASV